MVLFIGRHMLVWRDRKPTGWESDDMKWYLYCCLLLSKADSYLSYLSCLH
jgi:hypothetical protein